MKFIKFWPEALCIALFTFFSVTWVNFTHQHVVLNDRLKDLTSLEKILPQHQVQLLSSTFSDQLQYDNFAQLESQIDLVIFNESTSSELNELLKKYTKKSLAYIQLVTMLKTSQRLISYKSEELNFKDRSILDQFKINLFDYMASPSSVEKENILLYLNEVNTELNKQEQTQHWQLFRLHSLFILNNFELTSEYRHQLMKMQVVAETIKSITTLRDEIESVQYARYSVASAVLVSIFLIFIVIMRRQQSVLESTGLAYKNAVEVKTQFLANMSHEIRTPMTGIIGLVEICLQTDIDDDQKSYLEKVQFSANSLLTIINDILDFSKIESGQLPIEEIPFEHHKLIDNLNMMLGRVAEEKNIELILDLDPKTPSTIIGDPVRLTQILLNLLSNAVKFTEVGHVILRSIIVEHEDEDNEESRGSQIIYQIVDTGIGLTPEAQGRMFQRFSQADESTTRKYGGTGLGLAICKLLVELMSGSVKVESEIGKGSIFTVTLPLIEDDQAINVSKADKLKQPDDLEKYKKIRMLLVEDNKITQCVIQKMASHFGVHIDVTSTCKEAQNLCSKNTYDIALVDWQLQEETGLELIVALEDKAYCPEFIVVCSAFSKSYIDEHSPFEFELEYLAKPVTFLSFNDVLDLYLDPDSRQKIQLPKVKEDTQVNAEAADKPNNDEDSFILLAEDNKINQIVAVKLLEGFGLKVDIAENGLEAIDMVAKKEYKVVLMDIQMPEMGGVEATIALRKSYSIEALKIIALTANVTQEEVEYYASIGMDSHLGKPYESLKIRAALAPFYTLKEPVG